MADKNFGVKQINLIGSSGTPTLSSPNNLNLNAINVAISTDASVGGNISVGGSVVATSFIGDGSGLANIIGTGSGVEVRNAGSLVGTASTIDFSDYFSVSAISAGIATVSLLQSPGGGEGYWAPSDVGIHTTSNVGIGTTISKVALTVLGNSIFNGILTATTFSGNIPYSQTAGVSTYSNLSGISTSVIGGIGSVSELTVSGVSTISYLDILNKITLINSDIEISGIGTFYLTDLSRIIFGNDYGSSIYHDAVDLRVISNTSVRIGDNDYDYIRTTSGQGVTLFYGTNNQKLNTVSTGVTVTGNLSASGTITADSGFLGSGTRLSGIVTSLVAGDNISLSASTGRVTISGSRDTTWEKTTVGINTLVNVGIGTTNPEDSLEVKGTAKIDGGLNVTGVTTITNGGIEFFGTSGIKLGVGIGTLSGSGNIAIGDQSLFSLSGGFGQNIAIGILAGAFNSSGEYNIHLGNQSGRDITNGSNNVIIGGFAGNSGGLDIRNSSGNVVISDGLGNIKQYIDSDGNVAIGTAIVTEKLTVAGIVSATSFSGSGIGLTSIPSSELTGALPALDGSALFGVIGSGSGVIVEDDSSPIGTAGTINFTDNINVTFSSGIASVGVSSVYEATVAYGLTGNPTVSLGDVNAGVVTASSIYLSGIVTSTGFFSNGFSAKSTSGNSFFVADSAVGNQAFLEFREDGNLKANLKSRSNNLEINSEVSNNVLIAGGGGNVGIGTTIATSKFTVFGNGRFTGIVTASSFSGSGIGLTGLQASQLTGSLPAIDGSALLNVNASGEGIVIEDDGINIGTAKTVNFGTGIDVSYDSNTGIATITGNSGSGLQTRQVVVGVTTSIENNGIGNTDINGFRSYALMRVGLSTAGWIRLYTDSTSRDNDISRSIGEDPKPGSGVIAEVVTTGISTNQIISPFVIGGNLDNPADTTIYVSIKNLSGSTQSITANLTILQLEA